MIKAIRATKRSTCPKCRFLVVPGDWIIHSESEGWVHRVCPTSVKSTPIPPLLSDGQKPHRFDDGGVLEDDISAIKEEVPGEWSSDFAPDNDGVSKSRQLVRDFVISVCGEFFSSVGQEKLKEFIVDTIDLTSRQIDSIKSIVDDIIKQSVGEIEEASVSLKSLINQAKLDSIIKIKYEMQTPAGVLMSDPEEVYHDCFDWVVQLAIKRKPIFCPGPTGCGKTHMAEQLAKFLRLDFGVISCTDSMSESSLIGRSVPNLSDGTDVYQPTEFVRIYENGGVFLLDEIDASSSQVLLVLNSALANGYLPLPGRKENPVARMHQDFVCIAGANTFGFGGDRMYVGRNQLDAATLDRFRMGTVPLDYSTVIESRLCQDQGLLKTLWAWRAKIREYKMERVLSTRFIRDAYDMYSTGCGFQRIVDAFFSGWSRSDKDRVFVDLIKGNKKSITVGNSESVAKHPGRSFPRNADHLKPESFDDFVPF